MLLSHNSYPIFSFSSLFATSKICRSIISSSFTPDLPWQSTFLDILASQHLTFLYIQAPTSSSPSLYAMTLEEPKEADHYAVLEVSQVATRKEIKQKFHVLTHVKHPDKGGSHEQFCLVSEDSPGACMRGLKDDFSSFARPTIRCLIHVNVSSSIHCDMPKSSSSGRGIRLHKCWRVWSEMLRNGWKTHTKRRYWLESKRESRKRHGSKD